MRVIPSNSWQWRTRGHRVGFTIAELLVVTLILVLFVILLLPALGKARTVADRTTCSNNLRQLGIAAHNYAHDKRRFPPGVQMTNTNDVGEMNQTFGPNWAVHLLPHIDQGNLYTQHAGTIQSYMSDNNTAWRAVGQQPIPLLRCPADKGHDKAFSFAGQQWARGNYAGNAGPAMWEESTGAIYGKGDWRDYNLPLGKYLAAGVLSHNFGASLEEINAADGTTKTILFNEVRNGAVLDHGDPRGTWAIGLPGCSITAGNALNDCTNPNDHNDGSDNVQFCVNKPQEGMGCWNGYTNQAQARSQHPGGVNACFADGHVWFIRNDIPTLIWFYLLSRNDAIVFQYDF